MEKNHGIVNYDQLMKRSFKPEIPIKKNKKQKVSNNKTESELNVSTSQELNNNVKMEQSEIEWRESPIFGGANWISNKIEWKQPQSEIRIW